MVGIDALDAAKLLAVLKAQEARETSPEPKAQLQCWILKLTDPDKLQ